MREQRYGEFCDIFEVFWVLKNHFKIYHTKNGREYAQMLYISNKPSFIRKY